MKKRDEVSGRERLAAGLFGVGFAFVRALAPKPQLARYPADLSAMYMTHAIFGDKKVTNSSAESLGYPAPFSDEPEKESPKNSCPCTIL